VRCIGEALPAALSFKNISDEATYLEFGGVNYGGESLVVCAESAAGIWYRSDQIHIDRDVAAHRFDFYPSS
jgi:hypothetical protein